MQFIKNLFRDEAVIGLCALRKKKEFIKVHIPESYKRPFVQNTDRNYLLV